MAATPKPVRKAVKKMHLAEEKEMKKQGLKKHHIVSKKQGKHLFGK